MVSLYKIGRKASACALFALLGIGSAHAEVDLTGTWRVTLHEDSQERGGGPEIGDYLGLPINDEARARADAWQSASQGLPERQCILYTQFYLVEGPSNLNITAERDRISSKVTVWNLNGTVDRPPHPIYMDGRPGPTKNAFHSQEGFATGTWEGDTLTVRTVGMKAGTLRRNGVPLSEEATLTEHFIRHGELLTLISIVEDPIYLTAPYIRTTTFKLDPTVMGGFGGAWNDPCEPQTEIPRPRGVLPHYLPGQNPAIKDFANAYHFPFEVTRGGAESMYPEYRAKLKDYVPPEKCLRNCGPGPGSSAAPAAAAASNKTEK